MTTNLEDRGFQSFTSRVMCAVQGEDTTPADLRVLHVTMGAVVAALGGYIGYQKFIDWKLSRKWFASPVEARYYELRRQSLQRWLNNHTSLGDVHRAPFKFAGTELSNRYWETRKRVEPDLWGAEEHASAMRFEERMKAEGARS